VAYRYIAYHAVMIYTYIYPHVCACVCARAFKPALIVCVQNARTLMNLPCTYKVKVSTTGATGTTGATSATTGLLGVLGTLGVECDCVEWVTVAEDAGTAGCASQGAAEGMRDGGEGGGLYSVRNSAVLAEGGDAWGWEEWMETGAELHHMQVDTHREMKALLGSVKALLRLY
jgi:hypothetical protein